MRQGIDLTRFWRIVKLHRRTGFGRRKPHYLDLMKCLYRDLDEALQLGLHQTRGKRILDIGTGPGFFPYILNRLGHEVVATERAHDESIMWDWWRSSSDRRRLLRNTLDEPALQRWLERQPSL